MRGGGVDLGGGGVVAVLVVLAVTLLVGMQVVGVMGDYTPVEQTEHFDKSQQWCDAEGGELYVANDAHNAEHNGLHCDTGGETYHMWAVQELNYTHDDDALAEKCGATNVPLLVGCRGWGLVVPVGLVAVIAVTAGLLLRYSRGGDAE